MKEAQLSEAYNTKLRNLFAKFQDTMRALETKCGEDKKCLKEGVDSFYLDVDSEMT